MADTCVYYRLAISQRLQYKAQHIIDRCYCCVSEIFRWRKEGVISERLQLHCTVQLSLLSYARSYLAANMALSAQAQSTATRALCAIIQFSKSCTTETSMQPFVNRTHVTGYIYWVLLSFRQSLKANTRKLLSKYKTYLPSKHSPNAVLRNAVERGKIYRMPINAGGYSLNCRRN
jgi:hypothetical protein